MTESLNAQMAAIRTSQRTQFFPPIQIQASDLVPGVEKRIDLSGVAGTLWIPPTYVREDNTIQANPAAMVLGVRINLSGAPKLPWGLMGNNISVFTGPVECIYVTLLSGAAAQITFLAARGIGVAYSGGLTAAGTPSSAPGFLQV